MIAKDTTVRSVSHELNERFKVDIPIARTVYEYCTRSYSHKRRLDN